MQDDPHNPNPIIKQQRNSKKGRVLDNGEGYNPKSNGSIKSNQE